MRRTLGVNARLNLGIAAILAIVVGLSGYGLARTWALETAAGEYARTQESRAAIRMQRALIAEAESHVRGFLLSGDTVYLLRYTRTKPLIESGFDELLTLTSQTAQQKRRIVTMETLIRRRLARLDSLVEIRQERGLAAATEQVQSDRAYALTAELRARLDDLGDVESMMLPDRWDRIVHITGLTRTVVASGALIAVLIVLVFGRYIRREYARRKRSEELYRSVVGSTSEGVAISDLAGRVLDCNASAARILGVSREQIVGTAVTDWMGVREDGSAIAAEEFPSIVTLRTGEAVRNMVIGLRRADGGMRWLLVSCAPLFEGAARRIRGVVSSFSDITRRREAEAALAAEHAALQDFLDAASDMIVTTDMRGRIVYANAAWREALDHQDASAVVGHYLAEFVEPADVPRCREALATLSAGSALHDQDFTFVGRDGRLIRVLGESNCRYERGLPVATRSIFRDMTQVHASQEALIEAVQGAETANKSKSEFLANMSHELRTPLNSVIGFTGLLLRNKAGNLTPEDLDWLHRIHDNGRHLLGLINSILDLSKVEAGQLELELREVSVGALVDTLLAQFQTQVQGRPLTLVADCPAHLAPLRTDPVKLKQILLNLVGNAVKFTEGGSVTVRVTADPATAQVNAIEVADTGIGIPEDRREAVFEAFRQADNTTSRKYGGTGLGLTITRALCELLGYSVTLHATPGGGTTFRVRIGPSAPPDLATAAAAPRGRRVLVIDDDPDTRRLMTELLSEAGCQVLTAASGILGIEMAKALRPDLITLDLLMPVKDGLEVLKELKDSAQTRDIPVAVLSIIGTEQRSRIIGAVAIIDKPIGREELERLLKEHLPDAAAGQAAALDCIMGRLDTQPAA